MKNSGKTILFVTHDMGSVMKYCNRAIIFNSGSIVAEGEPAEMIDIYKKILVGQFDGDKKDVDDLIEKETPTEMMDSAKKSVKAASDKGKNATGASKVQNWKDVMLVNPNSQIYGDLRAEIVDFGIFDENEEVTNTIYKLKDFTIRMKIHFHETIENPIFAFSIKDIKGTELTGTNTIIERVETGVKEAGTDVVIAFRQRMTLQGGQYLLLLGCTGYERDNLVVYNRLYDICLINVIADKTTVGYFDLDTTAVLEQE